MTQVIPLIKNTSPDGLPAWNMQGQVRAARILAVSILPASEEAVSSGNWLLERLHFGPGIPPVDVSLEFVSRHRPGIGDYYVVSQNGYAHVLPVTEFESVPAQEPAADSSSQASADSAGVDEMASAAVPAHWTADGEPKGDNPLLDVEQSNLPIVITQNGVISNVNGSITITGTGGSAAARPPVVIVGAPQNAGITGQPADFKVNGTVSDVVVTQEDLARLDTATIVAIDSHVALNEAPAGDSTVVSTIDVVSEPVSRAANIVQPWTVVLSGDAPIRDLSMPGASALTLTSAEHEEPFEFSAHVVVDDETRDWMDENARIAQLQISAGRPISTVSDSDTTVGTAAL